MSKVSSTARSERPARRGQPVWHLLAQRSLLVLVAWALVWSWFAPQPVISKVLISYLLPESKATPALAELTSEQRNLLQAWSNPISWAQLQLQDPALPESLCRIIEAEPGPRLAQQREAALKLLRNQHLKTRSLGSQLLEISVQADNQTDADRLALGVVQYLKQQSSESAQKYAFQAEASAELLSLEEALQVQENQLRTRLMTSAALTQDVALHYASRHYQEAWNRVQTLRTQMQAWQERVQLFAPRLVVLAGPGQAPHSNRWTLRFGLLVLLGFLLYSSRVKRQ